MSNIRKQIRDHVVERLKGDLSVTDKTFGRRVINISESDLPCVLVFARNETSSLINTCPKTTQRSLSLEIRAMARANADLDDVLDDLSEEIEASMESDDTFGGLASQSNLQETSIETSAEGDCQFGWVSLVYQVQYFK